MFITTGLCSRDHKIDCLGSTYSLILLLLFLLFFSPSIFAQTVERHRSKPQSTENYSVSQPSTQTNNLNQQIFVKKKTSTKSATINSTNKTINVPAEFQTIQGAIDASSDGDTILVGPGIYKETLSIINRTLTLKGKEKDTTIIDGENENKLPAIFAIGGSVSISGFTIKNGVNGIRQENMAFSIIANNIISNNLNIGIHYINSICEILDNVISNNQSFNGARGRGIQLEDSSFKITGNNIVNNTNVGILIFESNGPIEKNTISDNGSRGLEINGKAKSDIIDNKVVNNKSHGILMFNTTGTITRNRVANNGFRGISIESNSAFDIFNNEIDKNLDRGIFLINSTCSIKENVINNNHSRGIEIVNGINIEITENTVNGNGKLSDLEGGITVFETNAAIIKKNSVNDNRIGLKIIASILVDISNNDINGNSVAGLQLSSSKNISILSNIISNTTNPDKIDSGSGISLNDSSALIKENNISFNDTRGIRIADVTSIVEIVENRINNNNEDGIQCSFDPLITGCCNEISNNDQDLNGCTDSIMMCPCPSGDPEDNVSIKPSSILLTHIGAETQLSAVLESVTGSSLNITKSAVWTTSDPDVMSVNAQGIVVSQKNGNAIICAEFGNVQNCIEVTVDTINAGINQWTTSADSRKLGDVNDIVIDSSNTDVIYAGSNIGDVFKSIDRGKTWIRKNNGLFGDSILALAIHPSNPDILFAGASQNLYKSTDGSENWIIINSNVRVTAVVISNLDPETIYIGTSSNGILKSIDGGKTWAETNNGLPFLNVREDSLVIDPLSPTILYLALEDGGDNGLGVFKTFDGGNNWQSINNSLPLNVKGLAIDPITTNILYAGTLSKGIYKTFDGGNGWFKLENAPHDKNQTIIIDNISPNIVYVGNISTGVLMSRDAGETWKRINTQLTNRSVQALKIDPIHPTTIYAGTFSGVFHFIHAFENIEAKANPDGTSIDIDFTFNKSTGIKPLGFNLYRSSSADGDFDKVSSSPLAVNSTNFTDIDFLEGSTHVYRMTVISEEGETLRSFTTAEKPFLSLNPNFTIEVIEKEKESIQGEKANYAINLLPIDGFDDEVFLNAVGLPDNVTGRFLPNSGILPLAISFEIITAVSTPSGEFKIEIRGTAGEKVQSDTIKLKVAKQGSKESSISATINAVDVRVEDSIEITGEIIPLQIGEEVTTTFLLPNGSTNEERSITDENGRYSVIKKIDKSGLWQIRSSWKGNNDLMEATSDATELFVSPVVTTITMFTDANFETKQGDTLTIIGKVSPNPGNGKIVLEIDNIDGSINFNSLIPLSTESEFSHQFRVTGGENGNVRISAMFNGNKDYVGNAKEISVPIQEPVGMAIIVAGGGNSSTNSLWKATNNHCNYAYKVIKNLGIPDSISQEKQSNRIFYLHPDVNNDADGDGIADTDSLPTTNNLQNTIKEAILELVNLGLGDNKDREIIAKMPLTIYMMGPGDKDLFNINETERITAEDLDRWLDDLFVNIFDKLPEIPPGKLPVNIIIESSQSGSFLDNLIVKDDGIGKGRTIVTSTDGCQLDEDSDCKTGKINITGDGLTSFSGQFLYGIKVGKSITTSWSESNIATREIFDNQRPQIDTNGNGTPNEDADEVSGSFIFINGNRKREEATEADILAAITAENEKLSSEIESQTFIIDKKPVIVGTQKNIVLKSSSTSLLWVIVDDPDNNIKDVQALIFPPKSDKAEILTLSFSKTNNRFESTFDKFNLFGVYNVLFVARDKFDNLSTTARTTVNSQVINFINLKGKVSNKETNKPLKGAFIKVQGIPEIETTNRKGNYEIPLFAGVYTVFVTMNGFDSEVIENIVVNNTTTPVNMLLTPKDGIIKGNVTDMDGNAIHNAIVQIKNEDTNKFKTTNIIGNYAFQGLSEGIYSVKAIKRGYNMEEQVTELLDGQVLQLDLTLNKKEEVIVRAN